MGGEASEDDKKQEAKEDAEKASAAAKFRDEAAEDKRMLDAKVKKAQTTYDESEVSSKMETDTLKDANRHAMEMDKQKEGAEKFKMSAVLPGEKEIAKGQFSAAQRADSAGRQAAKLAKDNEVASKAGYEGANKKLQNLRMEKAKLDTKVSVLTQTDIEAEKKSKKEQDDFVK